MVKYGPSAGTPLPLTQGGTGLSEATAAALLAALGAAPLPSLQLQAATPVAGYTLVNGTGTIISWAVPNDGAMHRVMLIMEMQVSNAETGGQINFTFNDPGGNVHSRTTLAGGLGAGFQTPAAQLWTVQANQTVTLTQATALTVGAAVLRAEIWGS
jgi:hypothetical protein